MARLFDDAQTEYLEVGLAVITAYPLTISAWFNSNDDSAERGLVWIGDKDVGSEWQFLGLHTAGPAVRAGSARAGNIVYANSTTGYTENVWHHAAGIYRAQNDRSAYIDGGSRGNNAGGVIIGEVYDRTTIGRRGDSTPDRYM